LAIDGGDPRYESHARREKVQLTSQDSSAGIGASIQWHRSLLFLLARVSFTRTLPAFLIKSVRPLWARGHKFRSVCADKFTKEHSIRTGVRGITGDRHSLAGLDGFFCPPDIGEIQSARKFYCPLRDFAGVSRNIHEHHRVRIHEFELSDDARYRYDPLVVIDR
jgi:hypothetical protein